MRGSGEGLRVGTDASVDVRFVIGTRKLDLAAYTVACTGKIGSGSEFTPTISAVDASVGHYNVSLAAADLDAAGDLALEFTFTGGPDTLNPNAKPLIIPVRAEYEVAS